MVEKYIHELRIFQGRGLYVYLKGGSATHHNGRVVKYIQQHEPWPEEGLPSGYQIFFEDGSYMIWHLPNIDGAFVHHKAVEEEDEKQLTPAQ